MKSYGRGAACLEDETRVCKAIQTLSMFPLAFMCMWLQLRRCVSSCKCPASFLQPSTLTHAVSAVKSSTKRPGLELAAKPAPKLYSMQKCRRP
jgi:hypothetical protein